MSRSNIFLKKLIVYRKFNDIKTIQTKTYIYDLKSVILKMQHVDDLDLRLLSELKKNGNEDDLRKYQLQIKMVLVM